MVRQADGGQSDPAIPDRMFFRIGDVSSITGVETHVLRFWETEFPALAPTKTAKGQRQYRRKDVETVLAIKRLLYDEGYTIPGARKAMRATRRIDDSPRRADKAKESARQQVSGPALQEIRTKLQQILELLKS